MTAPPPATKVARGSAMATQLTILINIGRGRTRTLSPQCQRLDEEGSHRPSSQQQRLEADKWNRPGDETCILAEHWRKGSARSGCRSFLAHAQSNSKVVKGKGLHLYQFCFEVGAVAFRHMYV